MGRPRAEVPRPLTSDDDAEEQREEEQERCHPREQRAQSGLRRERVQLVSFLYLHG
jgi:hypothetical protein